MAREMKDSGIEWIGEIPSEWKTCRLRFLCSIATGNQDTQDNDPDGIYPFYVRSPIVERSNDYTFEGEAILMAGDGVGAGKVFHYVNGKYGCHQRVYSIQRITNISRRFLYYYLCNRFYISIEMANSKSTVDSVRLNMLSDFPVAIPNKNEQQAIADFLDTQCVHIDSVIEKTCAAVEEYKKLKQAVITQAVTKGIRPNREMKDSGIEWIGEIPREWRMTKIKVGVSKVGSGKTPSGGAEVYADEGIIFLRSQNIYDTGIVIDSPTFITNETDEEMKNTRVQPNDVLLNITGGSIGRCCIFPNYLKQANVNQHVSIVRVIKTIILSEFMHLYWISDLGKMSIQLFQTGGNREGMTADAIKNSPIAIPDLPEQSEIVAYLDEKTAAIDSLIQKKEQLITELEAYKKSLIYEYVTGKKEVPVHAH